MTPLTQQTLSTILSLRPFQTHSYCAALNCHVIRNRFTLHGETSPAIYFIQMALTEPNRIQVTPSCPLVAPLFLYHQERTQRNTRQTATSLHSFSKYILDEHMYRWETCETVTPPSAHCESSTFLFIGFGRTKIGWLPSWLDELCYYRLAWQLATSLATHVPYIWCMYFVQSWKAKQGFGYAESDKIRKVTPIRQNFNQTHWKRLNIKNDIAVNVDVFNRRFVTQFSKVELDYAVD